MSGLDSTQEKLVKGYWDTQRASLKDAKVDYERIKGLIEKGSVSCERELLSLWVNMWFAEHCMELLLKAKEKGWKI